MKPKFVSFDMDDTLVKQGLIDRFWFEEVPKLYSLYHEKDLEESRRIVKESYDEIGPEDIRWYLPDYWFERFGFEEDPSKIIQRLSHKAELFPDALDVLDTLKNEVELIVITNAARDFLDVQLKDFMKYFFRTYSCVSDLGRIKKEAEVYAEICGDLGVNPEGLVHVGDHIKFDYYSPREIGVNSFLIDRDGNDENPEGTLQDMRELYEKIGF